MAAKSTVPDAPIAHLTKAEQSPTRSLERFITAEAIFSESPVLSACDGGLDEMDMCEIRDGEWVQCHVRTRPTVGEEVASSVSHGAGLVVALVAGPLLIARAAAHALPWGTTSASVFVATIIVMYLASMLYHALPFGRAKWTFRRLEHGAIFLLIAGTYTPFTLVALRGAWGWTMFGLVWLLAALGILLKAVATTRHRWLPGILYLALAWLILIAIRPLSLHVPQAGLVWLLSGGIAYTIGMAFFAAKHLPYSHFVWHLFVLAGTSCHFVSVWQYVV